MDERLMFRRELYVGGRWVSPAGTEVLDVVSPSTEEVVGQVPVATEGDIDAAVTAARTAFDEGPWTRMTVNERADVLERAAELVKKRDAEIGGVLAEEMGVVITQALTVAGSAASVFEYYAQLARTYPFERQVEAGPAAGLVVGEPVGVVGAIVPWNAPVTLAAWKLAPALVAGCTAILKPPPESPLSPFLLCEVLQEAGVPEGVVSIVPGGREVGAHLVAHPGVDKISFTGSSDVGKRIMSVCGGQVKRVSLELGGKSAAVLLDDADVSAIVPRVVMGITRTSGQVCALQSRVLVPRSRYDEAVDVAVEAAARIRVGDPHDVDTLIGPLVAERQRDRVEGYFAIARDEGATIAVGGGRPAHLPKGWYVEPTIITDVDNGMRVAQEEIFGPVLVFIPHDGDDDAVQIANDSPYGLAGAVWSGDDERGLRVARRIQTGTVNVNGAGNLLPMVPFGGFKESGIGRELGPEGLANFLETKTIGIPASLVQE